MKTKSPLYKLNFLDILFGIIIAFVVGSATALYDFLQNNHNFNQLDWGLILGAGAGPAVLFLINQFTRNKNYELFKKDQDEKNN